MKLTLLLAALVTLACSGDAASTVEPAADGATADGGAAGGGAADGGMPDGGALVTRNTTGGRFAVSMGLRPNPPIRGRNAMTLDVRGPGGGAAVMGATVTVVPFMPAHGHGSTMRPVVTEGTEGRYDVANVYLQMAGSWELRVSIASGDQTDNVTFTVSVP